MYRACKNTVAAFNNLEIMGLNLRHPLIAALVATPDGVPAALIEHEWLGDTTGPRVSEVLHVLVAACALRRMDAVKHLLTVYQAQGETSTRTTAPLRSVVIWLLIAGDVALADMLGFAWPAPHARTEWLLASREHPWTVEQERVMVWLTLRAGKRLNLTTMFSLQGQSEYWRRSPALLDAAWNSGVIMTPSLYTRPAERWQNRKLFVGAFIDGVAALGAAASFGKKRKTQDVVGLLQKLRRRVVARSVVTSFM